MNPVVIEAVVGKDRKLVIDVPEEVPLGPVRVVIQPEKDQPGTAPLTREEARRRLLAAGFLVTDLGIPDDARPLTEKERERWGRLPPGARPSDELIDEDRGLY